MHTEIKPLLTQLDKDLLCGEDLLIHYESDGERKSVSMGVWQSGSAFLVLKATIHIASVHVVVRQDEGISDPLDGWPMWKTTITAIPLADVSSVEVYRLCEITGDRIPHALWQRSAKGDLRRLDLS